MFIMKGTTPELINTDHCLDCKEANRQHQVSEIPGPTSTKDSNWGPGLPTTMRLCSGCGFEDGPWVSAELVGGGW